MHKRNGNRGRVRRALARLAAMMPAPGAVTAAQLAMYAQAGTL